MPERIPVTVIATVNLPDEDFDIKVDDVTSLDELEAQLTSIYPNVTSFVFVWSIPNAR